MSNEQQQPNSDSAMQVEEVPRVPPIAQQRREIKPLVDAPLGNGETWFLVEAKWFNMFREYVNLDSNEHSDTSGGPVPPQIDNSSLLATSTTPASFHVDTRDSVPRLQNYLIDKKDYELVPEEAWKKLHAWYSGGPAIPRTIIEQGEYTRRCAVELHPFFCHTAAITKESKAEEPIQFVELSFSKKLSLGQLKTQLEKYFKCDDPSRYETHLWASYQGSPYRMYKSDDLKKDLEAVLTRTDGQQLLLEVKDKSAKCDVSDDGWPLGYKHSSNVGGHSVSKVGGWGTGFLSGTSLYKDEVIVSKIDRNANTGFGEGGGKAGVCGLSNLGNTCFMNSALQCLTKTPCFRDYFCTKKFMEEVNYENVLGMKGKIAISFGNLMYDMWSGRHSYISPRDFKTIIGQFAPQFSGYNQQDSQELIAFLLDGLHEDLNRIKKKPATEAVEAKGRSDFVVSKEAWDVHRLRNDSIIVDKFQGQLKSTLICPEQRCMDANFVSITFDPFMYLSVPLPMEKTRIIDITLYRYGNLKAPVKFSVKVNKLGVLSELRDAIAAKVNLQPTSAENPLKAEEIVLADIFQSKVFRFLNDAFVTTSINDSDTIYAYEVPRLIKQNHMEYDSASPSTASKPFPFMAIRMTTTEKVQTYYYGTQEKVVNIGQPFVIPFDRKTYTNKQIFLEVHQFVKRFLKQEFSDLSPEQCFTNGSPASSTSPNDQNDNNNSNSANHDEEPRVQLFQLKWESYDDNEPFITFNDELAVKESDDKEETSYYYSYKRPTKREIVMYIAPEIVQNCVNKEQFSAVELDPSLKGLRQGVSGVSLSDCIKLYTSQEKLSKDDTWYCPSCKQHVQATKKFDIWRLPEILVIHLKRFQFSKYSRDKIDTFIDFPLEGLDMSQFIPEEAENQPHLMFDLYAVSNHFGGMGGGHYTAFAKIEEKGKWYKFDDSSATEVDPSNVKTSAGYVLFYRSRNASKEAFKDYYPLPPKAEHFFGAEEKVDKMDEEQKQ